MENNAGIYLNNNNAKLLLIDYLKVVAKDMAQSIVQLEPSHKETSELNIKDQKSIDNKMKFKVAKYQKMPIYDKKVLQKQTFDNKMQNLRNKKVKDEEAKYSHSPKILSKSKNISNGNEPIYNRIDKILNEKEINRNFLRHTYMEKNLVPPSKNIYNQRQFNKWVNDQIAKKKEQLRKIIEDNEKHEKSILDSFFKPNISKTPESISYYKAYESNRSTGKQSIYEKLYQHEENEKIENKKQNLLKKLTPSFKPTINKRVPKFKNYSLNNSCVNSKRLSKVHSKIITDFPTSKDNSEYYNHHSVNISFKGERFLSTNDEIPYRKGVINNFNDYNNKGNTKPINYKSNCKNSNKRSVNFAMNQNINLKTSMNKSIDFSSETPNILVKRNTKQGYLNPEKKNMIISYNVSEPSEAKSKFITSYDINVANFSRNVNELSRNKVKQKRVPISIRIKNNYGVQTNNLKELVRENKNNSISIRK